MANNLKHIVKQYILENYKIKEQEEESTEEKASIKGVENLLDSTQQRLTTLLRDITQPENKLKVIDDVLDYVMRGFNTMADLPDATLRNHFIKKFGGESNNMGDMPTVDVVDNAEDTVDEMSTTAGAPAPATKFAFKRKKK
jgi:hypothetical protein